MMSAALEEGRPVYAVLTPFQLEDFKKSFIGPEFR